MVGPVRSLALAALGAFALGACTPQAGPQPPTPPTGGATEVPGNQSYARDMSAADKAACTSTGGTVQRRGRLGMEQCVRPFADAGKACTDTSQCEGKCVGSAGSASGNEKVSGQCQADDRLFGCYSEIKDGKAAYAICVD